MHTATPHPDYLADFAAGAQLFDAGDYWEAHERWEQCWRVASEPDATFYKGIIQAAAALVHWQRGNQRGLWRNWIKARPRLVALTPVMHGIALHALIADMDQFVQHQGAGNPPRLRYQS